jgi:hypothetical protein
MEALQEELAAMPEKYFANFTSLLQDPLFQQLPDPRCRMVTATHILCEKKEHVPFSTIASFFSMSKSTIQQLWKQFKNGLFLNG